MRNALFNWFETRLDPFKTSHNELSNKKVMLFLWHYVQQAKIPFAILLVLGLVNGLLDVALFFFIGKIIDLLTIEHPATLLTDHKYALLLIAGTVLFIRPLAAILSSLISEQTIQANFSSLVRWQVHRKISEQSVDFFQRDFAGNISSKTWQSGQSAAEIMGALLQIMWSNAVYAFSVLTIFGWFDWRLSAIVAVWILLFVAIAYVLIPLTRSRARASAEASNTVNGQLVDVYANIQTIKLFSQQSDNDDYMAEGLRVFIARSKAFLRAVTAGRALLIILSSVAITVSGVTVISLWLKGSLSVGQVALILGLMLRLDSQLSTMLGLLTNLFRSLGTFQSSMDVATQPITLLDQVGVKHLEAVKGRIVFDNVTFGYRAGCRVIDGMSFIVEPGEKIGIVGKSGAGKSTLAHLLLRFYDVNGGNISIDGQDIRNVTQCSLRQSIGLVSQDTSLLHRSVQDNISIAHREASKADIEEVARRAHAHGFIESLEDAKGRKSFEAFVGERGLQLSGGQRQRIAIARVFLKNAPILILDEATSALDAKLDADIQDALFEAMRGKTVLAIAHRLSTIMNMDRIVVIDAGRIIESGTHNELLSKDGAYAELWLKQFAGRDQRLIVTT